MSEPCRFERDVLRAAEEDRWSDALRAHLATCDGCVAAASVAPWVDRFAKIGDREHLLPDPSVVWLKAKLMQGAVDAGRLSRPLDVAQMMAYLFVAGGWAAVLTWRWDALSAWLESFTPAGMVQTAASRADLSVSFFALVLLLASMTVMLALHTILAED